MKCVIQSLVIVLLLGCAAVAQAEDKSWLDSSASSRPALPEVNLPSLSPLVNELGQSVVNIRTEGKENVGSPFSGEFPGPQGGDQQSPFDFFFQLPPNQKNRRFTSLGSGFVIHPDGYIVTNNHVVEKASKIIVSFRDDKKTYTAELVGSDAKTDLALIKVNHGGKLPAAVLGDSDDIQPGDWVMAIGNPFRLGHTATVGIVSAKSRKIPGGKPYDSFIQTDASINPGNSGGPLFNLRGEVVGVNTAIFSPGRFGASGFNIGIGFAIPINLVKTIVSQIKEKGKVTRGWLGVLIQPVQPEMAEYFKLQDAKGALVADVLADSPADSAGFKRGDVIVKYDGREVVENDDLPLMVAETEIGREVSVEIIREGKSKTLKAKIRELKDEEGTELSEESEQTQLGLTVQEITPD
ncbi:MAG TPA: Do family serine endopeptidase, partial [Oligoflexia bacterium]|nr:Do family serine endopeptidase [Oligoflexia bacterium]